MFAGPSPWPSLEEVRRSDTEIAFAGTYNYPSTFMVTAIVGVLFGSMAWGLATELPNAIGGPLGLAVGVISASVTVVLGVLLWLAFKTHLRHEIHVDPKAKAFTWIRFSMINKPKEKRWTASDVRQLALVKTAWGKYGSYRLYVDFKDGSWLLLDGCRDESGLMPLAGAFLTGLGVPLVERREQDYSA